MNVVVDVVVDAVVVDVDVDAVVDGVVVVVVVVDDVLFEAFRDTVNEKDVLNISSNQIVLCSPGLEGRVANGVKKVSHPNQGYKTKQKTESLNLISSNATSNEKFISYPIPFILSLVRPKQRVSGRVVAH